VKYLEAMHGKQVSEAPHGIVAQMLVIDGVILQVVEQSDQIVRFRDEHAIGCEHFHNALYDRMHILDVRKTIGGRHHFGGAAFFPYLASDLLGEIALDRGDATFVGDLGDVGRLDAEDAVAAVLEVGDQRAVIRPDINSKIFLAETEHLRRFGIKISEVFPQDPGHATGVGVLGRKDDHGINGEAKLNQFAIRAMQQVGRKPGLLALNLADGDHLVDRRHVAKRKHGVE
jgi:hypothetical protein